MPVQPLQLNACIGGAHKVSFFAGMRPGTAASREIAHPLLKLREQRPVVRLLARILASATERSSHANSPLTILDYTWARLVGPCHRLAFNRNFFCSHGWWRGLNTARAGICMSIQCD
jgi:hypothetical protein